MSTSLSLSLALGQQSPSAAVPLPPPAAMTAIRSLDFGLGNGERGGDIRRLQCPAVANFMRASSALQGGVLLFTVQFDQQTLRNEMLGQVTTASPGSSPAQNPVFSNGQPSSATYHLSYYGASHATTANRLRYAMRISGGVNIDLLSAIWTSDAPHTVGLQIDQINALAYLVIIDQDGNITRGTGISTASYVGAATPGNTTYIGTAFNLNANDDQKAFKGHIQDYIYIRAPSGSDITDAQLTRLGMGEAPTSVVGAGQTLQHWYQLGDFVPATGHVAVKAGSGADLVENYNGATPVTKILFGPSVRPANNGSKSFKIALLPKGYVAGVDPDALTADYNIPITITNQGGGSTHFQASARLASDGQTFWTQWVRVTSSAIANGATQVCSLPAKMSDWLQLEVRREDDNTVAMATDWCGVGGKFMLNGQSREEIAFFVNTSDATVLAETEPGGASRVSFAFCFNHEPNNLAGPLYLTGNMAWGIVRERGQAGEGLKQLAKEWTAAFPNKVIQIGCDAVPGKGRANFTGNAAIGGWTFWGDDVTAGTGAVTELLLTMCKGPTRDITGFIMGFGSDDTGVTVTGYNSFYTGSGAVSRYYQRGATNLAYGIKRLACFQPYNEVNVADGTAAARTAYASAVRGWRSEITAFLADNSVGLPAKEVAAWSPDIALQLGLHSGDSTDGLHGTPSALSGMPRALVRLIPTLAGWMGLSGTVNANITLPAGASINVPRTQITISMASVAKNGGSIAVADAGSAAMGFSISTDSGSTFTPVDKANATLSGGVVTITPAAGDWTGFTNGQLRINYCDGLEDYYLWPAQFATLALAAAAMEADKSKFLVETYSAMSTTVSAGLPVQPATGITVS